MSQVRVVVCDIPDTPGEAATLFGRLADENISVDMIIQSYARKASNTNDIAFTINKEDLERATKLLKMLEQI